MSLLQCPRCHSTDVVRVRFLRAADGQPVDRDSEQALYLPEDADEVIMLDCRECGLSEEQ